MSRVNYRVTADFSAAELWCLCADCDRGGVQTVPSPNIMTLLQRMRDSMGIPLRVIDGVRCAKHNASVGGAAGSRHVPENGGDAVDVECADSGIRYHLVAFALAYGVPFVEVCPNHVHLDARPGDPRLITGTDH